MAINPKCENKKCGVELKEFGGILLSPPNKILFKLFRASFCKKIHLCKQCYKKNRKTIK